MSGKKSWPEQSPRTNGRPKNVTFPEKSLVTIWPVADQDRSSFNNTAPIHGATASVPSILYDNPNLSKTSPYGRSFDEPLTSFGNQNGVTQPGHDYREEIPTNRAERQELNYHPSVSAEKYFERLRRKNIERADSIEPGHAEWKDLTESSFKEERCSQNGNSKSNLQLPATDTTSASTERRYSAVVQQFMQKNKLATPQTESTVLTKQADQARLSEPSYVSLSNVDQDHIADTHDNLEIPQPTPASFCSPNGLVGTEDVQDPSRSVESFTLKSSFTPNGVDIGTSKPGLSVIEETASLGGQSEVCHTSPSCTLMAEPASSDDSSSSAASSPSKSTCSKTSRSKLPQNFGSFTPEASTVSGRSSRTRLTPAFRRGRFDLCSNNISPTNEVKRRAQHKMVALALIAVGLVMVISSGIFLLVIMGKS